MAEGRWLPSVKEVGQMLLTFFFAVMGWIIFRAESIGQAWKYVCGMCNKSLFTMPEAKGNSALIMSIMILLVVEWIQRGKSHTLELSATIKVLSDGQSILLYCSSFSLLVEMQRISSIFNSEVCVSF